LIQAKEETFTMLTCPSGFEAKTPYFCDLDSIFIPESKCKVGNACDTSYLCKLSTEPKCPSLIKCPEDYPIRCPDNTCASSPRECPNYIKCPNFLPIRCPNGDCRKRIEDCPSNIYCSDWGYLCNDGSCRQSPNQCEKSTIETTCIDKSLVRCSDGTCQTSILLCPSVKTCPADRVLSYSGLCKKENEKTGSSKEKCSGEQVLCQFDYSCASSIELCPTGIICPSDRPVRCWDMSCAATLSACPKYQECPTGTIPCPDGSCTTEKCGTHITCSKDAPYRCFDNTCRVNPEDCPKMPACPLDAPILCWDGRCLAERSECQPPKGCSTNSPIRCPNGICSISINECSIQYGCPSTFVMCKDGTCRKKSSDCVEQSCGIDLPYKCPNGMCVSEEKYCDKSNGCPFNKPYKCKNGACVSEKNECEDLTIEIPNNKKLCPDGSIISQKGICPLENGCPSDTPMLCGDGQCINPKTSNCSIPTCPSEAPYRCLDGKCVFTSAYCPPVNSTKNNFGYLTCADGKEAKSFEECRLLMPCDRFRCQDGSCKDKEELCPIASAKDTCPSHLPIRCKDGTCAETEEKCTNSQGCPNNSQSRCPKNGLCASKTMECSSYESKFSLSNGCSVKTPIKCLSGKCVKSESDCEEGNGCNDSRYKIKCPNGECAESKRACRDKSGPCLNPCPYSKPMECGTTFEECFNDLNCTLSKPFRCSDGSCKRYPKKIKGASIEYNENACSIGIRCPDHKPFLCADGQCVSKKSFCVSYPKCPENAKETCFDRTCVQDKNNCGSKCPAKSPLLCPNNNCVSSIYDCVINECPASAPIRCYSGNCLSTPYECLTKRNETEIESLCKEGEVTCYDGSCRSKFEDCPLFKGCVNMATPFKCPSGKCAKDSYSCEKSEMDLNYEECIKKKEEGNSTENGKNDLEEEEEEKEKDCWHYRHNCTGEFKLCEDGICRKECPNYNGCPFSKPLLCSNGECVENEDECAGESNCPDIDNPFRCIDGKCVKSLSECSTPLLRLGSSNIMLSSFKNYDINSEIIIGESNTPIGSIHIPTNALLNITGNSSSYEGQILFNTVPQNELVGTFSKFDNTRKEDVLRVYPFADPDSTYSIDYIYSVLSSVIEIKFDEKNIKVRQSLLLTLMFDFPTNIKKMEMSNETANLFKELDPFEDVCLAKLKGMQWECEEGIPEIEKTDKFRLKGAVTSEGIYAVILNPSRNEKKIVIKKYWLITNLKAIAIIGSISAVIILTVAYYLMRQYRFIMKYKENQLLVSNQQKELESMADLNTSVVGQSFEDVAKGVVFTDNPAYKKKADRDASSKRIKEETEYYKVSNTLSRFEKDNKMLKEKIEEAKRIYKDSLNDSQKFEYQPGGYSSKEGNESSISNADGKDRLLEN
jgi:hypothetical protein